MHACLPTNCKTNRTSCTYRLHSTTTRWPPSTVRPRYIPWSDTKNYTQQGLRSPPRTMARYSSAGEAVTHERRHIHPSLGGRIFTTAPKIFKPWSTWSRAKQRPQGKVRVGQRSSCKRTWMNSWFQMQRMKASPKLRGSAGNFMMRLRPLRPRRVRQPANSLPHHTRELS